MPRAGTPAFTMMSKTFWKLHPSETCGSVTVRSTYIRMRVATIKPIDVSPMVHATHRARHHEMSVLLTPRFSARRRAEGKPGA